MGSGRSLLKTLIYSVLASLFQEFYLKHGTFGNSLRIGASVTFGLGFFSIPWQGRSHIAQ